jgi:hypothetical protein
VHVFDLHTKRKTNQAVGKGFSQEQSYALSRPVPGDAGVARANRRLILTYYDKWVLKVYMHAANRMLVYPLPGLRTEGARRPSVFSNIGSNAVDESIYGRFFKRDFTGTGSSAMAAGLVDAQPASVVVNSRYAITRGRVNTNVTLTLDATETSAQFWILFDPLEVTNPVRWVKVAANGLILGTAGNFSSGTVPWTSTPFMLATNMVNGGAPFREAPPRSSAEWENLCKQRAASATPVRVGDFPTPGQTTKWDVDNMYYAGGADISVDWINSNAYTNCSIRARDTNNTIHRFYDAMDELDGTTGNSEEQLQLGFLTNFEQSTGAAAGYSGTMWDLAHDYGQPVADDVIWKAMADVWHSGKPFIQLRLSNVNGVAQGFDFSVSASTWLGTAPLATQKAGGCVFETVPFQLPDAVSQIVSASAVHPDHAVRDRVMSHRSIQRMQASTKPATTAEKLIAETQHAPETLWNKVKRAGVGAAHVLADDLKKFGIQVATSLSQTGLRKALQYLDVGDVPAAAMASIQAVEDVD